uniref:Uncharacterized protein n=1 Tax=Meloidogyne enterolobii TaxID=390850 RepID=A0A6V7UHE2_MELEN|nr:unnamed protein product [Meloidogyne enterolobii]
MKFALFLLAFLWSFSQGNGGGSQTSALSKHAIRLASIRLNFNKSSIFKTSKFQTTKFSQSK